MTKVLEVYKQKLEIGKQSNQRRETRIQEIKDKSAGKKLSIEERIQQFDEIDKVRAEEEDRKNASVKAFLQNVALLPPEISGQVQEILNTHLRDQQAVISD